MKTYQVAEIALFKQNFQNLASLLTNCEFIFTLCMHSGTLARYWEHLMTSGIYTFRVHATVIHEYSTVYVHTSGCHTSTCTLSHIIMYMYQSTIRHRRNSQEYQGSEYKSYINPNFT